MKRYGLIGVMLLGLLVMAATPAMANIAVNTTDPTNLTLVDVNVSPTLLECGKNITVTMTVKNTNSTTNLTTDNLYVKMYNATGAEKSIIKLVPITKLVLNNTTLDISNNELKPSSPGYYNVTAGNSTTNWSNTTVTVMPSETCAGLGNLFTIYGSKSFLLNIPNYDYKFKGPISNGSLGIASLKLSDDQINLGDSITVTANWDYYNKSLGTRRIVIVHWTDYKDLVDNSGNLNTASLLDKAKFVRSLPEDGGSDSWSYTPDLPGYYVVVAYVSSSNYDDRLVFRVVPTVVGKPSVSISVDRTVVAQGDYIKVKASMTTDQAVTPVKVFVSGMGLTEYLCNYTGSSGNYTGSSGAYTVKEACGQDEWWVPITTARPEGVYVAKIDVGSGEIRAEATATFQVVKPDITSLTVPAQHVKARDLVIEGTCNLAKSGTEADSGSNVTENYAHLVIKNLAGKEVFNDTIASEVRNGSIYGLAASEANSKSLIDTGGKFRFKLDNFGRDTPWGVYGANETGFYVVEVKVCSGDTCSKVKTATFEIVKASVKLSADKTTVTRGDDITFTITTNLKINNKVIFEIEDRKFCADDSACEKSKDYYTDAKGQITIKLKVANDAPLIDYKFTAKEDVTGVSDSIRVTVVKQTLDIKADRTTVARGGEVRFTGTSTAEWVYVYVSPEGEGVFDKVPKLPDETYINTTGHTFAIRPSSDKKLDFKVNVNITGVEPGTYYLYIFAPANKSMIDKSSDPQAMIPIVVTDPRIISFEAPSKVPYQGKFEVSVFADPGDRKNVEVRIVLSGPNIASKTIATGDLDANNYYNKTIDLREIKTFAIDPGLYVLKAELRFKSEYGGEKADEVSKMVEIVSQKLDVTVSSPVVIGEKITVSIDTNRQEAGYNGIFVTLVGTNYKVTQRATLDSTGKATVTFETYGMSEGTYKLYVRDTSLTPKNTSVLGTDWLTWINRNYDLDPASQSARSYEADDDLLVVRTVEIVKELVTPTPTPTTPVPTTPTPTPTPTTPTPTPTTPKPTTPVTTPSGGIPGFEAIFAIAGLLAVAYLLRKR